MYKHDTVVNDRLGRGALGQGPQEKGQTRLRSKTRLLAGLLRSPCPFFAQFFVFVHGSSECLHTGLSRLTVLLIACAVALCCGDFAQASDDEFWPQFHGPKRDNISTETGLLKRWPEKGPNLVWSAKGLGHGFSTVAIDGKRVFTAGNIEDDTVVTAMDMTGKILWQTKNGKAWKGPHPGTRATPTIDGDRIYHKSPHGDVACLDAETGKTIWTRNILKDFSGKNIRWALSESLLIDGDRVICCPGGPETSMVALDKNTGKTIWKAPSADGDLAGYASPRLIEHQGMRIILTMTAKAMIGVNAGTGALLWRFPHESHADENVLIPLFQDGHIFVSTLKAGSVKWKLNVNGDKASVTEVWRSKELDSHHDGIILIDGHIYGASRIYNKLQWVCLNWETGEKLYAHDGAGRGSVTYAGGHLYTYSEKGVMALVKATPDEFNVISKFDMPKQSEGPYWAHPVVCDGRLYLRHSDYLYVYDVGKE